MNWDAVARARIEGEWEWVLVEAKGHKGELESDCTASAPASLLKIDDAFAATKDAMGVNQNADWKNGYYQYANRLAVLHFLQTHGCPTRLLFIYFVGDLAGTGRNSPQTADGWLPNLSEMKIHLGLYQGHGYSDRLHNLFLSVGG